MILIPVLNGKITIHDAKKLYANGRYQRRLFISSQNDREFCDLALTREQVEELIKQLKEILQ